VGNIEVMQRQISFAQNEFASKKRVTRKEAFLAVMEQVAPRIRFQSQSRVKTAVRLNIYLRGFEMMALFPQNPAHGKFTMCRFCTVSMNPLRSSKSGFEYDLSPTRGR